MNQDFRLKLYPFQKKFCGTDLLDQQSMSMPFASRGKHRIFELEPIIKRTKRKFKAKNAYTRMKWPMYAEHSRAELIWPWVFADLLP